MTSPRSETYFSIGMLVLVALLVGLVFLPELDALVLGVSIAILFQPLYALIKQWLHDRSALAAAIIVLIAIAIILVPLVFFGIQIFTEAQGLYGAVDVQRRSAGAAHWMAAHRAAELAPVAQDRSRRRTPSR